MHALRKQPDEHRPRKPERGGAVGCGVDPTVLESAIAHFGDVRGVLIGDLPCDEEALGSRSHSR